MFIERTTERMARTQRLAVILTVLSMLPVAAWSGCSREEPPSTIVLATTTSTRDSGLLDVLIPQFEAQTGHRLQVIAVGSGQALELGRRGDADVLLTHAPEAEEAFVRAGHAALRRPVMHNDFVIVGPPSDPAGVAATESAVEALDAIAAGEHLFVSRGDHSGTHMKEQRLWELAGIEPSGSWYLDAGSGMAQTLRVANEKWAYTLTDRGTLLAVRDTLDLVILHEGDPLLLNKYAVLVVAAETHTAEKHAAAVQFAEFLTSPETQQAIGSFGVREFGQPLFFPHASGDVGTDLSN